ncbi:MAG: hypothetical protein Q9187_008804 [Circinaria calcarea]
MSEQSKIIDSEPTKEAIEELSRPSHNTDESDEDGSVPSLTNGSSVASSTAKKKKSRKAKLKKILGGSSHDAQVEGSQGSSNGTGKPSPGMMEQLLEMNPSLKGDVAGLSHEKAEEALKRLNATDLLTGMSISGKNQKDMASYKFWQTQPVPRFDEAPQAIEGPIKIIDPDKVPREPRALYDGFEWVTMDLMNEKEQLEEVYELLSGHYVEDDDATFRLNYSASFFNWALKSPGWRQEWHIGVRVTKTKKLVAFISGVPVTLRVRSKMLKATEINFLCVHKRLRDKRLTPVLIEEITRRCYIFGIYQAIYTAGIVLPKPVSVCRYFHRPLDWLKLFDVGFSPLPKGSTKARQITKNYLPTATSTKGLRPMQKKDIGAVQTLLDRYLKRFDMAPEMSLEEVEHWLLHDESATSEQVIWTYVVENPSNHQITDFFSFYSLESSVIGNPKYESVRAAYLYYYATDKAFEANEKNLKERLNALILDALILAKKAHFDVFNALTLLDNPLFLESLKFGPGDGSLHFYLYNYRTAPIAGGIDAKNNADETARGGVGIMML